MVYVEAFMNGCPLYAPMHFMKKQLVYRWATPTKFRAEVRRTIKNVQGKKRSRLILNVEKEDCKRVANAERL